MERKPKTVFQLDSPFAPAQWPTISDQDQQTILELLCSLLSPIGRHRSEHLIPSKGKRSKKRKFQGAKAKDTSTPVQVKPPPPDISPYVVIGLNSITRHLQLSSPSENSATPETESLNTADSAVEMTGNVLESTEEATAVPSQSPGQTHLAAVFVTHTSLPAILHAHLPPLIANSCSASHSNPVTKLVGLPKGSDGRLCAALGLARVSFVGILDGAPHSKVLLDLVQTQVPDLEPPAAARPTYLPVKVNAVQTTSLVAAKT
ncbi:hypothetical protein PVAG01_05345 [Phlyctema vagabunda]|uniref:Uncharacterized protein n=1 Tax=Phlyctema vagabunda TaxID=108571 RepID=A0ABR4PJV0_9HELO